MIMRCDFSKAFEQAFRSAVSSMPGEICLSVLHTISLSVVLEPHELIPSSLEWQVVNSLQEQAKKEFDILNRRSNPDCRPVIFTIKFA